ncbi:MAG: PilT/PilU family type 4a pilus ATPase [Deltaproteobacteria bacterium]|nr:PilT/PilU family type 4a pilus ATPase [Deltaproteobacteria bacterium]
MSARIDSFLAIAVEQGASDLHLRAGNVPVVRHEGELVEIPFRTLSDIEAGSLIDEMLTEEQRDAFRRHRDLDLLYQVPGLGRFRVNCFQLHGGPGAVFRIIPKEVPSLGDLGLPTAVARLARLQNGLVLVTGPTGSGKSTTLAAIVNEINRSQPRHILTIEDPIEYTHIPARAAITQRQVGRHVGSFAGALRSALRESPDVVVVGEMRDAETMQLALTAAETGILVLGTLHTSSAAKSVSRIVDGMPESNQDEVRALLAMLLRGVVAQELLRKAGSDGRVAVIELLLQTHAVSTMIRDNKAHLLEGFLESQRPAESGMQSRDTALLRMVRDGLVLPEDALSIARRPDQLKLVLDALARDEEEA